ncbi:MAG TPA: hypothetical protein VNS81_09100 [Nocardioides sp.]|nr:hypothetical protein [Nocardioides sp.]
MTNLATPTPAARSATGRQLLNKVPEVTLWFWVIKILCTTVGESFADYINETLGFGLTNTTILFTAVFVVVLTVQMRLRRYVPAPYWLTVVVVSVAGTLYTDILTDSQGVPLWISTSVFSVLLAVTFAVWWVREGTLSIHSITTTPRESFYWLTVLVTFALGTATGDWTLELTGWGPGVSILLPAALIAIVALVWRFGGNPVLTFWVAYILTRPLGANIGDFLSSPRSEQGLGLGTLVTSLVFLGAILATVVYLTITRRDVIEEHEAHVAAAARAHRAAHRDLLRERAGLAVLGAAALATAALLTWANAQPHADALAAEEGAAPSCSSGTPLTRATAPAAVRASFPAAKVAGYRTILQDTTALVGKGDQAGAARRITDLETAWDHDQNALQPKDCQAWTYVDGQIDDVLSSVRASSPDPTKEKHAMQSLLSTLG